MRIGPDVEIPNLSRMPREWTFALPNLKYDLCMDRSRTSVLIGLLVACLLAGVCAMLLVNGRSGGGNVWVLAALGGAGLVVAGVVVVIVLRTRTRRGSKPRPAEELAERLDLDFQAKAEAKFHRAFGSLPGIPRGGTVSHVFRGNLDGRSLTAFQHHYIIVTGQAMIPVYHIVFVTDAPNWPDVSIVRRNGLARLLYRLGMRRGLLLEDEVFNSALKIKTADEDFALTLIGPQMQKFLASTKGVNWAMGSGRLAMVQGGTLKVDRFEASLDRIRRFWELTPAELDAW